ncbi:hypothetical protein FOVG_19015 [Fusarium oxysporum f. sp. pisi HDV247]|uniref:Uncharacterized protein n=1 Tax=Fusarium oxysporum f. sp. pisi HDV247 TaxID=1080344 RepID=W9NHN6_FUSOX|nr:hypothetical protein FOVG_19015 [Fusarium oxysporum f. sp. pisi HDV247]
MLKRFQRYPVGDCEVRWKRNVTKGCNNNISRPCIDKGWKKGLTAGGPWPRGSETKVPSTTASIAKEEVAPRQLARFLGRTMERQFEMARTSRATIPQILSRTTLTYNQVAASRLLPKKRNTAGYI